MGILRNNKEVIVYTIDKNFNNNLYISVQNGEVVVNAPWYFSRERVQRLVEEKKKWILNKIDEYESSKEYIRKEMVKILGEVCKIKVNYRNLKKPTLTVEGKNIKISLPNKYKKANRDEILNLLIEKMYDLIAEKEIENAMEKTRLLLGVAPEDYVLKRDSKMLGRCIEGKIIEINPDIVKYDREIIDYIVLHEFCHLKYKTHSKKFYEILEKYIPQYRDYEEILEKDGLTINKVI